MPRTHPPYPPEYRQQIVELALAGRSPAELVREFEPSGQTIRNWVRQAEIDAGRRHDGPTTTERQELARLRRESKHLRLEREILAKAAAWFAQETNTIRNSLRRSRRALGARVSGGIGLTGGREQGGNDDPNAYFIRICAWGRNPCRVHV